TIGGGIYIGVAGCLGGAPGGVAAGGGRRTRDGTGERHPHAVAPCGGVGGCGPGRTGTPARGGVPRGKPGRGHGPPARGRRGERGREAVAGGAGGDLAARGPRAGRLALAAFRLARRPGRGGEDRRGEPAFDPVRRRG